MARTSDSGGWDQDLGSGSSIVRQTPTSKPKGVVRDDWDDDDDDEDEEVDVEPEQKRDTQASARGNKTNEDGESNRIWQEANKRTPMPELIVAPASVAPPPPAALQPTLRILKRPSPTPSSGLNSASGGTSPAPRGTLAEREAQYQEARSRIFGEKEKLGGVVVGPASELELESGGPAGKK